MLYYDKLRYNLLPYVYSLAGWCYVNDYTMMRGLIMDFRNDPAVKNINDEYMFGPALLINPVYEYNARDRDVYLPAGTGWYDLYSGKHFNGGNTIKANAPYEKIPVFVKEGAIIPFGVNMQYTNEKKADSLTLYVYAGRDGAFDLYEDEDTNYNYEQRKYSIIPISYNEVAKTLTIGKREGSFEGMIQKRIFNIVWIDAGKPVELRPGVMTGDATVQYDGNAVTIKMK
jgi:alpha-D-xyloside xylohydrolase